MHCIGIDIGTASVCGVIYNVTGEVMESVTLQNNALINSSKSFHTLQDAEKLWLSVLNIVACYESKYSNIAGIGVTGQMHGILYVDKNGDAVSPLYTWQDKSGDQHFVNGISYAKHLHRLTGYEVATGYGLVTHFYLLQHKEVPETAVKICTIMDYVVMKLTGNINPVTDACNATGMGFFDIQQGHFDKRALQTAGIDAAILPAVVPSASPAGCTQSGIPVFVATGDNQASFLGSVQNKQSSIHITIGTSSQISIYTDSFLNVDQLDTRPFPGGGFLLVGAALSGGQSLAILQSFFDSVLHLYGLQEHSEKFYELINYLEYSSGDSHSLFVKTLFNGSRVNPEARGSILNISAKNLTAENIVMGFVGGIVEELYDFYQKIPLELKSRYQSISGSGNALKRIPLLCEALEAQFQLPVVKSGHPEDAALGACKLAMASAGIIDRL